ncbi:MAG: hypothetical protein V8T01_00575 [Oscillospiraceae bacterium]
MTLYAQWVPEGQTAVYLSGKFYGLANAGTTYMLPAAGNDNTIVTGWQEVTCNTENSSEQLPVTQTTDGGCQVDIPANASELWLYPKYQYVGAAVIDGKTYQFTENETFFSGDGWQLQSLYGGVQLRLNGYHGGAIDLPYTDLVTVTVSLYGDNSITGGTDAPALYSAGDLRFDSRCEANQHTSLTVTAGSGQNAVSAKQIQLAAHITLTGGTGATAVSSEAKVLTAHNYSLCDGAGNELTGGYNTVPCLKAMPTYATVTLNGNGGKATDGSEKETLVKTYENGIYAKNLDRLFKKDGALYAGYAVGGRRYDRKPPLHQWRRNGRHSLGRERIPILFLGFHTEGAIKEKLDYDFGWGAGYLFRDNSKTVIAPTITYQDPVSNGNLVYWYPESNISDPECGHQYLPGETVNEADGTVLSGRGISQQRDRADGKRENLRRKRRTRPDPDVAPERDSGGRDGADRLEHEKGRLRSGVCAGFETGSDGPHRAAGALRPVEEAGVRGEGGRTETERTADGRHTDDQATADAGAGSGYGDPENRRNRRSPRRSRRSRRSSSVCTAGA